MLVRRIARPLLSTIFIAGESMLCATLLSEQPKRHR